MAPGVLALLRRAAVPFLLVAGITLIRFPDQLFRAEFWAEDATEFFFGAMALGPDGLLVPVYGYSFLVERLIALAATFLPVFYTPYVYAWSSLIIGSAAFTYLARDGFSWIAPRRWQRILLAALLAVGPGTAEVLLNLTNLQNPLALLGFLVLVERPYRMGLRKLGFLALLAFSSGLMLLWIPVAAWLAWSRRSRGYLAATVVLTAAAAMNAAGTHDASKAAGSLDFAAITRLPEILATQGFARLVPAPFLGPIFAGQFQSASSVVYWTVAASTLLAVTWLARRGLAADRDATVVLLLGYAGSIAMLGLIAITRSYNVPLLSRQSGTLLPHVRYSFLPMALATLLWASLLLRETAAGTIAGRLRLAAAAILAIQLATGYFLRYARPDLGWAERSGRVQWLIDLNRQQGRAVLIRMGDLAVHPVGWVPDNRRTAVQLPGQ